MNTLRIIEREGYRLEDLNLENQKIILTLRSLLEDFENGFEYESDDFEINEDGYISTIGKIKEEIADEVIQQAIDWIDIRIADYQISLSEMELDENQDKK